MLAGGYSNIIDILSVDFLCIGRFSHESLYEKEAYLAYTTEEAFPTALAWDQPDFFEREV